MQTESKANTNTTKPGHTPGPWTFDKREWTSEGSVHYEILTAYNHPAHPHSPRFIAFMTGSLGEIVPRRKPTEYRDDPQTEADCRLIAAAPALYEALATLVKAAEIANIAGKSLYASEVVEQARAALALVKGGQ